MLFYKDYLEGNFFYFEIFMLLKGIGEEIFKYCFFKLWNYNFFDKV